MESFFFPSITYLEIRAILTAYKNEKYLLLWPEVHSEVVLIDSTFFFFFLKTLKQREQRLCSRSVYQQNNFKNLMSKNFTMAYVYWKLIWKHISVHYTLQLHPIGDPNVQPHMLQRLCQLKSCRIGLKVDDKSQNYIKYWLVILHYRGVCLCQLHS